MIPYLEKLLNEIEVITVTDYEITPEELDKVDGRAISIIEDLLGDYLHIKEKYERFKEYVDEYYIYRGEQ